MAICAILMIYVFRKLGYGRISGGVMGGIAGALLGIGIYYVFNLLRKR
ncbi:MAG: hypothetical protein HC846_07825 [Blastocatellia bacterium]|nr:hypothetical protein [Blastocatellia bacterium]